MTIASNSHPGPTDNLPGNASHRQPTASNAIAAGHRGSRVCGSIILVTAIFRTGIKLDCPTPGKDKRPKYPSLLMPRPYPTGLRRLWRGPQTPQALRASEILRLSPSSGVTAIVQVHCCPQPHPAHNCHEICLKRNRPSDGSIVSARADVSSNPCATNAAKHCWI